MSPDDATPDVPAEEEPQELLTGSAPQEGETEPTPGDATIAEESSAELVTGSAPQEGEGEDEPEAAKPKRRAARTRKAKVVAEESVASEEPQADETEEAAATVIAKVPDEAEAEEAPARGRRSRPAARRAVVRAQAKYVRTSARKARMVCGHIRGKSVDEARAILAFTPRDVARDWSKLLESAVANAENNHELVGDDLIVHEAYADEGPTIKRFRPRAMGRATPIRKRTSHLTITLTPRS